MSWFDSIQSPKLKALKKTAQMSTFEETQNNPWKKCSSCDEILQESKLVSNLNVCPNCGYHFRLSAYARVELLTDKGSFVPFAQDLTSSDPLQFYDKKSYKDRLSAEKEKTGLLDGTLCGIGKINSSLVSLAVMNFQFMGGSMGVVTGEKIALVMDKAVEHKCPAIVVSSSGGARMQEGLLSLMQMAKTSAARGRLLSNGLPFISVLTDPTTGGVAASFATLGDLNIAEPGALIGFAGPRVIEQSISQKLPQGFQRSEFLRQHGLIDRIVPRSELKNEISFFVDFFMSN